MTIPTTEAEAIAELKRISACLENFGWNMANLSQDSRYSTKDRELAATLAEYVRVNSKSVADVATGISIMAAQKNPGAIQSIVDALTKK